MYNTLKYKQVEYKNRYNIYKVTNKILIWNLDANYKSSKGTIK